MTWARLLGAVGLVCGIGLGLPVWAAPSAPTRLGTGGHKAKRAHAAPRLRRPPQAPGVPKRPPSRSPVPLLSAPALDLSVPPPAADAQKARQELVAGERKNAGGIDFGGNFAGGEAAAGATFEFGGDQPALDVGDLRVQTAEQKRFDAAMLEVSREAYEKAAVEFKILTDDKAYSQYADESAYQLAKALYKLGYFEAALQQLQAILQKGPTHRRYRKAVEWMFFMSRKLADQTPVLAQLARYRNVTFPPAYRSEYHYLLAKYLFTQANEFEVKRLGDEALRRDKSNKAAGLDFGAIADALATGEQAGLDFSKLGGAQGLDFGEMTQKGAGLDFMAATGEQTGALDFAAPASPALSASAAPQSAQEAIKQSLDLIDQVAHDSIYYPRARYLKGLLHYLGGEDQKAVEAFLEVVRLLNPRGGVQSDASLREMAFLSLARLHYGYKQFDRAVYYYNMVDRDSESWLTALYEASWGYYRRGDFDKALGNLLTLHAPFFEKEYFPESQIVKAIIYFEACRYPETRGIVDDFLQRYTAVLHEVQKVGQADATPQGLAAHVGQMERDTKTADDTAVRVLNLTLSSPEIKQARDVLQQVQTQRAHLQKAAPTFLHSSLGEQIDATLQQAQTARAKDAGAAIKSRFEQEEFKLKGLLAQALRIKIEVARAERELLERRVQKQESNDALVAAPIRNVVDDAHVFWPYQGEYWRDELGTYELDFSMCKQNQLEAP